MANKKEYALANKQWLEEKAKEEGVKALPRGSYYKVVAEGKAGYDLPSDRHLIVFNNFICHDVVLLPLSLFMYTLYAS